MTSPLGVFVVAIGIGVIYQILFALVIIVVRVQPIIVALSGFLALSGINRVILPRPGGVAPDWMISWGLGNTIFSPVLLILVLATGGWLLFTLSPFFKHLRMMGYDERAAFTAGVRSDVVRVGAHVIAGIFVGLGAICYTALIASGDPTQGTTMSLTAVTAVVLGGVSLAGGRGTVTGALLGATNLFLIGYVLATFQFGPVQGFVTQLLYGLTLIASLLLTMLVPIVGRYISFISPFAALTVLGHRGRRHRSGSQHGSDLRRRRSERRGLRRPRPSLSDFPAGRRWAVARDFVFATAEVAFHRRGRHCRARRHDACRRC